MRDGGEVVLLGSGAADGWPNPFCECASCLAAAGSGRIRGQTSALVDGRLLLDCGPETPRSAVRAGRSLAGVRHLLLTHSHPDHLGPAALLFRHWAGRREPLDVVGPADVVAQCRPWAAPDDPVRFIEVAAGDEAVLGERDGARYRVRVLAADHAVWKAGDAVLYDVAREGAVGRILWATDTGPLPDPTARALAGARFDAVFLDETFGDRTDLEGGHLNLATFPRVLAELRRRGAVVEGTQVVAVHLSHHNPPPDELDRRLRPWGVRAGEDGMVVPVPGVERREDVVGHRRTLVLGGARSGKSTLAEEALADSADVTYLATGGNGRGDLEWLERVAAHRERRPGTWRTVETTDVAGLLRSATGPVLLDCLGTWLTARIDLHSAWEGGPIERVEADIDELVAAWRACPAPVVAVSNEVGSGVVPATASGRLFRDLLGRLNARIAAASDEVLLVVAGLPVRLR
ncbi:bifunctional adenosylcobinamide kinase/adenosylcobinamide-phosphate guanylyltransferase [Tomitella gaofuii]|uniref:bifunctional adenosylcobinamide kinase/adenosylcobinamide-phosphate guanylyltransferase n=1 Tax=Tomitella gaofuii TaxID=2760083 RepID=UPI0015FB45F8|nr:bifunctional adenosylcobinamide kinase/adenosylcobinamide-phosphate guanylyltransferase [Tomitella gaofuii]